MSELNNDKIVACAIAFYVALSGEYLRKFRKRKRRWWTNSCNKFRKIYNGSGMLIDLTKEPSVRFQNFCRMSSSDFEYLLNTIGPVISKKNANIKTSCNFKISCQWGQLYISLAFLFKISKQTVSRCVDKVCKALIEEVKLPQNEDEWLDIAKHFEMQWNFPNCLGAIDGKHVVIQCPPNSATEF